MQKYKRGVSFAVLALLLCGSISTARTTAFLYQGRLTESGNPANNNYDSQFKLFYTVAVGTGTQQGSTVTVLNVTVGGGVFTACISSLRYKTTIQPFHGGLSLIQHLRPITFTWKESGLPDIGLAAEEVAAVDEQFIFRNPKGQIEGVRYTQLSALFINAFKEQQAQIQQQQQQIREQQTVIQLLQQQFKQQQQQIDALRKLLCQANPQAEICQ